MAKPLKLVLRRAAKADLAASSAWYEEQRPGLGPEFRSAIEETLESMRQLPLAHPQVRPEVRRAPVRRFPFGIFYVVQSDAIRVIAILHRARGPDALEDLKK